MTELLYLHETYLFEGTGNVQSLGRDERGAYIVLDQTIFYPQGGGQPADRGHLRVNDDDAPVTFVGFHDGDVRHYVPDSYWKESYIGGIAALSVDRIFRMDNARLHTGGHLISHVLETLDAKLIPIKGYHFPNGSYVEFVNEQNVDAASLIEQANAQLVGDVGISYDVAAAASDFATISRLRPHLAPFIPKDKPSRIVAIGNYIALPCGGTHVANLAQLGSIKITKVKRQKTNVRVSYEVGEPVGFS